MDTCTERFATLVKFMTLITETASDEGLSWPGTKCHERRCNG